MRNPIEQTFGYMKRCFSIMEKRLDRSPKVAGQIFIACACLHNIAMQKGDVYFDNGKIVNLNNDVIVTPPERRITSEASNVMGRHIRSQMMLSLTRR